MNSIRWDMVSNTIDSKPNHGWNNDNEWADFIELSCLANSIVSKDDIVDLIMDEDSEDEMKSGTDEHSEQSDILDNTIDGYFKLIRMRSNELKGSYPFELKGNSAIKTKEVLNNKNKLYISLLLCSSISRMDPKDLHTCTYIFEKTMKLVFEQLNPPGYIVELFGTSREKGSIFCGPDLKTRIEKLAETIGSKCSSAFYKTARFKRAHAGDAGIDIVGVLPVDNAQYKPYSFAQCTCSYSKWLDKQGDIGYDAWKNVFDPFVEYPKYMFVPFVCRDASGKFCDVEISTFVFDRLRIMHMANRRAKFTEKLLEICKIEDFPW